MDPLRSGLNYILSPCSRCISDNNFLVFIDMIVRRNYFRQWPTFLAIAFNPLTLWIPGDFLMLVYWGSVLFHTPFQSDFLPQKIIFFHLWTNFGRILALFWGLLQTFSIFLTILAFTSQKWAKITTFTKYGLQVCYIPQKKAKII